MPYAKQNKEILEGEDLFLSIEKNIRRGVSGVFVPRCRKNRKKSDIEKETKQIICMGFDANPTSWWVGECKRISGHNTCDRS